MAVIRKANKPRKQSKTRARSGQVSPNCKVEMLIQMPKLIINTGEERASNVTTVRAGKSEMRMP